METGDTLDPQIIAQAQAQQQQALIEKPMWLTSWKDHLASAPGTSPCLELCDLNGDSNYQLVIGTIQKRLKVFSGTSSVHDSPLLDIPVGVVSYYPDYSGDGLRVPLIAVASGNFIFMYKSLRPYFKFTLPPPDLSPIETAAWKTLSEASTPIDEKELVTASQKLDSLKEAGLYVSHRTVDFLALETPDEKRAFIAKCKGQPLATPTVVTCISLVKKDREDADAVGQLIVGTESQHLFLLDKSGAVIQKKTQLPSVPVNILTSGLIDTEYRVLTLCRDGRIYICKNGVLQPNGCIQSETMITCFARMENHIVCGTMSNQLLHFSLKGTRVAALPLPSPVAAICPLVQDTGRQNKSIVVALANTNEIRVYTGKTLINKMAVSHPVLGLKVGRYGTEDSCLCVSFKTGVVTVMMLPRTAKLDVKSGANLTGPPKEQDRPLPIPKRTNVYVEQMQRERDNASDMYRSFHRDVCKLRLMTTRAYARIATDLAVRGGGDVKEGFATTASLRLNCAASGLGPSFRLRVTLQNTGAAPEIGLYLVVLQGIYSIVEPCQPRTPIPSLVPSVIYTFDIILGTPENYASSDVVKVLVCGSTGTTPLASEVVAMPLPDGLIQEGVVN